MTTTYIEECFETKRAIFYSDKIILKKKKRNIIIDRAEIDKIDYARPTFYNYLSAGIHQILPGQFAICLKKSKVKGKKSGYVIWIKYDDFLKLPYDIKALVELY